MYYNKFIIVIIIVITNFLNTHYLIIIIIIIRGGSGFPSLKVKWKWSDIRPSMVTYIRNLCSAINPSKVHTHTHTHTHTVNTHPEQWAAIYAAAHGEQLGVRCLAQGHLSRGIEVERALDIHSPHLQFIKPESHSLTIRPRLPLLSWSYYVSLVHFSPLWNDFNFWLTYFY